MYIFILLVKVSWSLYQICEGRFLFPYVMAILAFHFPYLVLEET